MFRFSFKYFIYTVLLFLLELFIGLFVQDKIIRPYIGDFIVVVLIYYILRTFLKISPFKIALGTLLFAYVVEISQYFKLIEILNLKDFRIAKMILGSAFSWEDILMYTLGVLFIYFVDTKMNSNFQSNRNSISS